MKVNMNKTDNGAVLTLEGEMMLGYEANDFHEAIISAIDNNYMKIIVDLSKVQFISSWGIGILIFGHTTTTNRGGEFILTGVSDKINAILVKTKLDKVFKKFATVKDALKD